MSIKQQVDDATFLAHNERYVGALALLLVAVAASSRKAIPERGTGDKAAFKLFLGARLKNVLFASNIKENIGLEEIGMPVLCRGRVLDLVEVLSEVYRGQLGYATDVPSTVEFAALPSASQDGVRVSCNADKVMFSVPTLDILRRVVVDATCNAQEFK